MLILLVITRLHRKLDRYFEERQTLINLHSLKKDENASGTNKDIELVKNTFDTLSQRIEGQQTILSQLDDTINTDQIFSSLEANEMMYIMDKLTSLAVNFAIRALQKEDMTNEASLNTHVIENVDSSRKSTEAVSINNTTFKVEPKMKLADIKQENFLDENFSSNINYRRGSALPCNMLGSNGVCGNCLRCTQEHLPGLSSPNSIDETVRGENEFGEDIDEVPFLPFFPHGGNDGSVSIPRRSKRIEYFNQMKKNKK